MFIYENERDEQEEDDGALWEPENIVDIIDDDGNSVNTGSEDGEQEQKQKQGKTRFDRRIDKLTAQKNDVERVAYENASRLHAENENLRARLGRVEQGITKQHMGDFKAKYDAVVAKLHEAKEEGNTEEDIRLTEQIADMRSAARVADLRRAEGQQQQQQQQQYQQYQQQYQQQQSEAPPKKALGWWDNNRWFNGPEHEAESAYARVIDQQLDSEGFNKNTDEYYAELDNRLQSKFPELYKNQPRSPTIPRGGRGPGGNKRLNTGRVRLTSDQMNIAKSLGITDESALRMYAREIQEQGNS